MSVSDVVVQKFGGSSLAQPEQIVDIAKRLSVLIKQKKRVIAVVSAMG